MAERDTLIPPGTETMLSSGEEFSMMIREPKPDPARAKEVKVKIPVSHHIKLHSMKVLTGKQISDAVTEALDFYFANHAVANHTLAMDASMFVPEE